MRLMSGPERIRFAIGRFLERLRKSLFFSGLGFFLFSLIADPLASSDLTREVFFFAWDPWLQTGCRIDRVAGEVTGFRIAYDGWFRVSRAVRVEAGQEKDVWTYRYDQQGKLQAAMRRRGPLLIESAEYDQEGRFFRLHKHQGMSEPQTSEEYVYRSDGRLMVVKSFRGRNLEMISEVRYHPSGKVFMHVITNGGNAVIGRVIFDTDEEGRVLHERHFLWGWLVKVVTYSYCPHGALLSRDERTVSIQERVRDPFFVEPGTP